MGVPPLSAKCDDGAFCQGEEIAIHGDRPNLTWQLVAEHGFAECGNDAFSH